MALYQALVKHLDGHTQCLQFATSTLTGQALKQSLHLHGHPHLRLVTGTSEIADETSISASEGDCLFPSLTLLPRLRGGKGGFGSLLRGAGTKAGQKKTNNFDACRDMSGRRLRHVNAEKKLDEWKEEAEDRRLVKLAEDFLKKKAKEVNKGKQVEVDKYLEKYREDAEMCMEKVDESVRESFRLYREGKRKVLVPAIGGPSSASKRLKIWMGKKKVDDSDSEDDVDEEDIEEKSVVLDSGNCTSHAKDEEGTSAAGSPSSTNSNKESSGGVSEGSSLDEVIGLPDQSGSQNAESGKSDFESNTMGQSSITGDTSSDSDAQVELEMSINREASANKSIVTSTSEQMTGMNQTMFAAKALVEPQVTDTETAAQATDISSLEEPVNFDKYNSSAELEALGMERLKSELQSRGLKCGGTLQERAARLFLLKTTPFEKLPKKVLAGKAGGK